MVSVCGVVGMDGWVGVGVGVDAGLWDHKCDCMGCTMYTVHCVYIYIYAGIGVRMWNTSVCLAVW